MNNNLFNYIFRGQEKEFFEHFKLLEDCNKISEYNQSLLQQALATPLKKEYVAAQLNIAEFLIKHKCNLNHQDKEGYTALHYIIEGNRMYTERYYLIDLLLDAGARLDLEDKKYKNQPLFGAVMNSKISLETVQKFLEKGADPHHKNIAGISPYDMVVKFNIPELTEIFRPYI